MEEGFHVGEKGEGKKGARFDSRKKKKLKNEVELHSLEGRKGRKK